MRSIRSPRRGGTLIGLRVIGGMIGSLNGFGWVFWVPGGFFL